MFFLLSLKLLLKFCMSFQGAIKYHLYKNLLWLHSSTRPSPTRVPGGCSEARPYLWHLREAVRKAALALHPHWLPLPLPSPWSPERGAVSGPFRPFGPKLFWNKRKQGTTGEEERGVWGLGGGLWSRKASRAVRGPNVPAAAAGAQRGCGTEGPWQAGRGLSRI